MVGSSSSGCGGSSPPPFAIGGPTTASWREHVLARVGEHRFLVVWLQSLNEPPDDKALAAVRVHLDAAKDAAAGGSQTRRQNLWSALRGASVERARSHVDAAEMELLLLAPEWYLVGQLPNLLAHVRAHLPSDDPRRVRVEELFKWATTHRSSNNESPRGIRKNRKQNPAPLQPGDRDAVVSAVREASSQARREVTRVRSYRNLLWVSAGLLALGATGMIILGSLSPSTVPLCFNPTGLVVCPTEDRDIPGQSGSSGQPPESLTPAQQEKVDDVVRETANPWDIAVVELVGLLGAALGAAHALRRMRGTSTEFSLPVALAVLKLPTGALTALLGLLLMRGGFVPGLTALDTPAQILSWALIFGTAQQLVTRFVDQKAQGILDDVGRPEEKAGQPAPIAS
jgi:hypothetical protein